MKASILILAVLLSVCTHLSGQSRTIYGRVVDEDGAPVLGFYVEIKNMVLVGKGGLDGKFKVEVPQTTQNLFFSDLGYEPTIIKLTDACDTVEVVMMNGVTYDFISSRKIDRLRLRRFNKLAEIHLQAYKAGIFTKESVCYSREFKPDKPALDSITKEEIKTIKHLKLVYRKLNIGDTVKIPFSEEHGRDGTDLNYYSIFASMKSYSYVVKCVITAKNTHRRHYNLVCRVVNCSRCNLPSFFMDKLLKIGSTFTYNIKFFKILEE